MILGDFRILIVHVCESLTLSKIAKGVVYKMGGGGGGEGVIA